MGCKGVRYDRACSGGGKCIGRVRYSCLKISIQLLISLLRVFFCGGFESDSELQFIVLFFEKLNSKSNLYLQNSHEARYQLTS